VIYVWKLLSQKVRFDKECFYPNWLFMQLNNFTSVNCSLDFENLAWYGFVGFLGELSGWFGHLSESWFYACDSGYMAMLKA